MKELPKWFVDFPTYQYKEDVQDLAAKNQLEVVDARYKKEFPEQYHAANPPKLTPKSAKQMEKVVNQPSEEPSES